MGYYCCGIYAERPEMCKRYPESGSYIPEGCTYYFADGERKGFCDPECQSSCCQLPRHQGEPTAPGIPEIAGGLPCKYLEYRDEHPALSGDGQTDTEPEEDRGDDREESDPLELALAEIDRRKRRRAGAAPVGGGGGAGESGPAR